MSSGHVFPPEIEELILDAFDNEQDHVSLKACSLVCQAYLPACQKRLYSSVVLNSAVFDPERSPGMTTGVFERLLSARPDIGQYVRRLQYSIQTKDLSNTRLHESLKLISRLESFTVHYFNRPKLDWNDNPLRPALLHLLHLPTLTHFKVFSVDNFLVSDLIPCVNLRHLDIGRHTTAGHSTDIPAALLPERTVQLKELNAGVAAAQAIHELCTARRADGKPVIEFSFLTKITTIIEKPLESHAAQELFKHCTNLSDVDLSFWDPIDVEPSIAAMLRPSIQTLRQLSIHVHVNDFSLDPLFGIPDELEDLRAANNIENIALHVLVQTDISCGVGDAWGKLDDVLSKPGWPSLKTVSLAIDVASYSRVPEHNEFETALRKLRETQFTRLSSSEAVKFDFKVTSSLV